MKNAYRVHHAFSHDEILFLMELNQQRDIEQPDPWSLSKLQGTHFLNSAADVRKAAMVENASGTLGSEDAMDYFCCKMNTEILLQQLVANGKVDSAHVTPGAVEQVLYF